MAKYNNKAYEDLINTIISDAFYTEGLSFDAKISQIRRFTEVVLRRLLNYQSNRQLTVGDKNISRKLEEAGFTEPFFNETIKIIVKPGNKRTHTQVLKVASEEDYQKVLQGLFNLYGYMFYKYFKRYKFGSNTGVLTSFSILPPIIRHIALSELIKEESDNYLLAEKLLLATIKAFDSKTAKEWLESQEENLKRIPVGITDEEREILVNNIGYEMASLIINGYSEKTAYDVLNEKLKLFKEYKPVYTTFEEAVAYYKEYGILGGDSEDVKDFNDLMEFVYIGRREAEKELKENEEANYILENIVFYLGTGEDQ